ncbi:DUF2971 domain-containing protein [Flavobacterium sp. RNTU_13]|uniref:DUF2971 domain-containing protein n=1 Tax=Flavobacterium sp. RNTU_13 TaxID=3375145 RepID=UPI0039889D52
MENKEKINVSLAKLEDIELPPVIYKYRTWTDEYHKRFLNQREVFLASPKTFEDELDCNNPTRFDLLTKQQIYNYFMWSSKNDNINFTRQQHRHFARYWSKVSDVNHPDIVKKFMKKSTELYYEHEGILSLTENWNNDLMWEKYGGNHQGICIGYNTKVMFKHLGGGGPVKYCDELTIVMPEPFMSTEESLRNRVYFKLRKWTDEEEYRTQKFWPHPATIQDRQIQLPSEAFNKIILGNSIPDSHREEIISIVNSKIGNIEIISRRDLNH